MEQRGLIDIVYYTDPLCCWSWGFEPQWRKLQFQLGDQLRVRYVMSGLLPSWNLYNDPVYSVSRPMQMGAVWLEAKRMTGMPMHDRLWADDPPASSYPACIAVKAAQLQSEEAGVQYLRRLREAVMIEGRNVAKQSVLLEVAEQLQSEQPGLLELEKFAQDLINDNGLEAFRKDWQEAQNSNINRFPTLIIRSANSKPVIFTGYRPYDVLFDTLVRLEPQLKSKAPTSPGDYSTHWGNVLDRELEEAVK